GPELTEGPPRLLGLGDSFVFGWGVEEDETFLARAAAASGFAAVNAGVPGYGVCQEARLGLRLLDAVRPEAVLVALTLDNDEMDPAVNETARPVVAGGGLYERGYAPGPARRLLHAVTARSHLLRLLGASSPAQWIERRVTGHDPHAVRDMRYLVSAYRKPVDP